MFLSLAATVGGVFLCFYIGWAVQQPQFEAENNILAKNFSVLFAVPAVADPWSAFSCFLYGALILAACGIGAILVLMILACLGCPLIACCFSNPSDRGETFELVGPSFTRTYQSFPSNNAAREMATKFSGVTISSGGSW